jgi:hypothetical protein
VWGIRVGLDFCPRRWLARGLFCCVVYPLITMDTRITSIGSQLLSHQDAMNFASNCAARLYVVRFFLTMAPPCFLFLFLLKKNWLV